MKCPQCGHTFTSEKARPRTEREHPGPDATDAELYAYYKATAPRSDLEFTKRNASERLRTEIERLLAGRPTPRDAARARTVRRMELQASQRRAEPGTRPATYMDWTKELVTPTHCRHCGLEHEDGTRCRSSYGRSFEDGTTFEVAEPYESWAWRAVPAAEFERKFRRVARDWRPE
jgi:predicted Zn-ribbon and HTH transcriptional regulator